MSANVLLGGPTPDVQTHRAGRARFLSYGRASSIVAIVDQGLIIGTSLTVGVAYHWLVLDSIGRINRAAANVQIVLRTLARFSRWLADFEGYWARNLNQKRDAQLLRLQQSRLQRAEPTLWQGALLFEPAHPEAVIIVS